MPLETTSKIDSIFQNKRQTSFFAKTLLFIFIFFSLSVPFFANAACCVCQHPQITTGTVCISKENTACTNLGTLNDELKPATCKTEDSTVKCRLVKDGGICVNNPNTTAAAFKLSEILPKTPSPTNTTTPAPATEFKPVLINLNVAIPGADFSNPTLQQGMLSIPYLSQYIQAFYKLLIGISLIAAAIMIVYGGFRYIISATTPSIQTGKQIIIDALMGLVIVLGAYVILANVNPNLTQFGSLTLPFVEEEPMEFLSPETHNATASGSKFFSGNENVAPEEIFKKAKEVAQREGVDPCIVEAIIKTESSAKPNAIGHDENFAVNFKKQQNVNIPQSRTEFLRSRKYFSGKIFSADLPIMPPVCDKIFKDGPHKGQVNPDYPKCRELAGTENGKPIMPLNDDVFDPSKPDYNLDKRFSHGFGLSQLTIFPKTPKCDGYWSMKISNTCFTAADLLTVEGGIMAIIKNPVIQKNKNNPSEAFWGYIGSRKGNEWLHQKKMTAYQNCAGQ
jgi:hypothetical protein